MSRDCRLAQGRVCQEGPEQSEQLQTPLTCKVVVKSGLRLLSILNTSKHQGQNPEEPSLGSSLTIVTQKGFRVDKLKHAIFSSIKAGHRLFPIAGILIESSVPCLCDCLWYRHA